jgi:hypothetical protein
MFLEKPGEYSGGGDSTGIPEGFGTVQVNLTRGAARTIMPEIVLSNLYLKYSFTKDGGTAEEKVPDGGGKFILEPGTYTLEVQVFADDAKQELVADGESAVFTIIAGDNTERVSVNLRPIVTGTGTGTLEYDLKYPDGVTVETLTLIPFSGDSDIILKEATDPTPPTGFNGTKTGIPVGYYLLQVKLEKNSVSIGRTEVVHIYQNLTARAEYEFIADDFEAIWVSSADDDGTGTLRAAINRALAVTGGVPTIQVILDPGMEIELISPLPAITKSLIIEGNSVILTRADTWTASDTSQLLCITDSTAEVQIRRMHFKNGLSTKYGGVIDNRGILTLESCIFSGNRTTSASFFSGGAVYSENTLTIRGCTFYGNTSSNYGGAVTFQASGKTLTLTGNLFYRNTAEVNYPVVYNWNNSGAVSASYNVVDVNLGTGTAAAGVPIAINNATISALPISPLSFKLLAGSGAGGKLPAVLPADYPVKDFYGNPISGGGAAGAVQAGTENTNGYYYLELSVNNSQGGSVTASPEPDDDGLYPADSSINITESLNTDYSLGYWLVNGEKVSEPPTTLSTHTWVQAVFTRTVTVTDFTDGMGTSTAQTLRYALTNAEDGDIIMFSEGVTAGTTVIALGSALPEITKSLTIEGNGVTLTRAASWTPSTTSQLLRITGTTAEVVIRRMHFKNGRVTGNGGAIQNTGILTVESCIFSGNQNTVSGLPGGALYSGNTLTIRGCTFYGNTSGQWGGAVAFSASGKTLTLTGNLFYRNTTVSSYPVVYSGGGLGIVSASYNVVDVDLGTGQTQAGWGQGPGDETISGLPVSPLSFKLLAGSGAGGKLPAGLPADYPVEDFYGDPIGGEGAAGAVQDTVNGTGYYFELSVNNSQGGSVSVPTSFEPDEDGLYPANSSINITESLNTDYSLGYWLVNGEKVSEPPTILSTHTWVEAVFNRAVTVTILTDGTGMVTPGTLRYALTHADDGDIITLDGVTAGATVIELSGTLPEITKSLTIKGNGVILTRAASWTAVNSSSQLLRITGTAAEVQISRVHFKDSMVTGFGGAIYNRGILTLESCIFSGNRNTASSDNTGGGAINSENTLTIRGCTFYGNTSSRHGGAVYFSASGKTLTLTGNLFYGNTAGANYPVVQALGTTVNASYNVVDVALGTGQTQAGWTAGTGDETISDLPISPLSFRLLNGSGAGGKLPSNLSVLPDYPTKDFYGNSINDLGAAGAVQESTTSGYYYLDLSVNDSERGTVTVSPSSPDDTANGLYSGSTTINIMATPASGYGFSYWLVNGVENYTTPFALTLTDHTRVQAVFNPVVTVDVFTDESNSATTPGTLRYALTNAKNGDVIILSGVTAGTTKIKLKSALPRITKSLTIEGKGVTLTRDASWTAISNISQLLNIDNSTAEVQIRGVHFKDGLATVGGAIYTTGLLTLESCIFSGNKGTSGSGGSGGAISSSNDLTIRGCTFYGNTAGFMGGAVYFSASGKTLTLTGNLFYGNTAAHPVVYNGGGTVSASYNVVDVGFGTGNTQAGWNAGTGDETISALPISPLSFKLLYGSEAAAKLPATLPADYPDTDFCGEPINGLGAAGAVVNTVNNSGYYLDLSVNNSLGGTIEVIPAPDEDGLCPAGSVSITANPNSGYSLVYWLVDGVKTGAVPASLTDHIRVQAVFNRAVTVSNFTTDNAATPGTLRYALTNAQNGDVITLSGVIAGTTVIELTSPLPPIIKSLTIEGNGVTLTPAVSLTATETSQLLRITDEDKVNTAEVVVRRVHFKNSRATVWGGAINNDESLILESCIFSGNQVTGNSFSYGGAINSGNDLTIRGCTFYGNTAPVYGGVMSFTASKNLTLTGNLFYGNTAPGYPLLWNTGGGTVSASYNVIDVAVGSGDSAKSGWNAGTGDETISVLPISPLSFKLLSGSGAGGKLPATLPADYPDTDFYGEPVSGGEAAGAVQASTASGYYLDYSVNDSERGSVTVSASPDADGLYPAGSTITATPLSGYGFAYWLVNGVEDNANPLTISVHSFVQAVFHPAITVTNFDDDEGTSAAPTLRYALTNADDGYIIKFSGVTAGTTEIPLESALPKITKSLTIEGSGVTLTPAASWTTDRSPLLWISNDEAEVVIRRVHFTKGQGENSDGQSGGAIRNTGILTLESCIFSENNPTGMNGIYGAAIYSENTLAIRGCTFYGNKAATEGGAVYFAANPGTLTLTGNLFYENDYITGQHPVVHPGGSTVTASYNVVDDETPFGTESAQAGWERGTGDKTFAEVPLITGEPFVNLIQFVPVSELSGVLPSTRPANFPTTDFYGTTRDFPGAPGAVAATPAP